MDYPFYLQLLTKLPTDLIDELAQTVLAEQGWIVHNYFVRTELKTLPKEKQSQKFRELVQQVVNLLEPWLPSKTYSGHALNMLEPGKTIAEHTDINTFASTQPMQYVLYHKIHVPLITNSDVISEHRRSYHMPTYEQHMIQGHAYAYNDYVWHGGRNDGTDPRIHLLIKYFDPKWENRLQLMKKLNIDPFNTYEV